LKRIPNARRRAFINEPFDTPLEDIRAIFDEKQVSRYTVSPLPNQFELNETYERVAAATSHYFDSPFSVRQVKRCVSEWAKFENSLHKQ
jgi:hypothetical protein